MESTIASTVQSDPQDNQQDLQQTSVITDQNGEVISTLSKRKMKKLAKEQKWLEKKAQDKESGIHKKKHKKSQSTYAHLSRFNSANQIKAEEGSDQQKLESQREPGQEGVMKTSKKEKQQMFRELCQKGPKYIIDCEFEDLMQDRELKSLSQQLAYCHSVNKKMDQPLNILVSGIDGKLKTMIEKSNCQNWAVDIKYSTKYIDIVEDKSKLVYLTADSENLIETLDDQMTYIVGGIVDHNRYKLLTYKKATEQGIQHGRLPIRENVQLTHSAVLTVNHVFSIIAAYYKHNGDWKKALTEAIPERKRKALEEVKDGEEIQKEEEKEQSNE